MRQSKKVFWFKLFLILVAVALFIAPDAAAGAPEIERRVLVSVLGIDRTEESYTVTAQVVVPKRSGTGEPEQEVVKAEGRSVPEGIEKLNRALGRNIELGHCGVIVLGDTAGAEVLQYFLAGGIVTAGTGLVNAEDAAKFIESVKDMSASTATGLDGYISYSTSSTSSATNHLLEFVSASASQSATAYMPVLKAEQGEENTAGGGGESAEQPAAAQEGGQSEKKTPTIKSAERTAVFVNYAKVGELDETETRGLAWIDRTSKRGFIELDTFEADGVDYGRVYAQLKNKSAKLIPRFVEGRPMLCVKVRCKLELEDKHNLKVLAARVGERRASRLMQDAFGRLIQSEIGASMIKAADLDADPFGIKNAFYRFGHDGYQKYDQAAFMDDVRVEYDIRVSLH